MVMQSYDQFLEQFQQRAERYVAEFDESIRAVQKELEQRRKKGRNHSARPTCARGFRA